MTDHDPIVEHARQMLPHEQAQHVADLHALGAGPMPAQRKLERFECPDKIERVEFITDELCCTCPVTGQPDIYRAKITTVCDAWCIESKSLKLYLWSFRDEALFAEQLADVIAQDVFAAVTAIEVVVELAQNMRGGIVTIVKARETR